MERALGRCFASTRGNLSKVGGIKERASALLCRAFAGCFFSSAFFLLVLIVTRGTARLLSIVRRLFISGSAPGYFNIHNI